LIKSLASGFWVKTQRLAGFFVQFEIWVVVLITAASFIWLRLLSIAVFVAIFFWLLRWVSHGRLTHRTPVDAAAILLLVMALVTVKTTSFPERTAVQVFRLFTGMALFYAIVNWSASTRNRDDKKVIPRRLHLILLGTGLAGLVLAIFAFISVQWSIAKIALIPKQVYQKFPILVSDTVHPNAMAGSLILFIPIPLAGLLFNWRKMGWAERIIDIEALLAMLIVMVLTQSRGAWMALGIAILALVILRWRFGWLILVPVFVLLFVLIIHLGITPLLDAIAASGAISGINGRMEIWSRAVYMIKDFPLTGIGMGSFMEVADALYPFFLNSPGTIVHAHNLFLQIPVDLGIPGFLAWLVILIEVVVFSWQIYHDGRNHQSRQYAALGAGLLSSQIALIVHGLTDATNWGMMRSAPFIWVIWALAVASWMIYVQPKKTQTNSKTEIKEQ